MTPQNAGRIQVSVENQRYFQWRGDLIYLIGATESGAGTCNGANGWLAISSDFDWQPDLEALKAHGGNYARIMPYFPGHPTMPWVQVEGGLFDLQQINPEWTKRLREFLAWTEANGVVVQLELFENFSFSRSASWLENPWHPAMNVNYGSAAVAAVSERANIAMYKALSENQIEVIRLLQHYVASLVLETLEYGNVIYSISNESNAPLDWAEHWADYIHRLASSRGMQILVGEMPHAAEPSTGVDPIMDSRHFDFVDASSVTSEDEFGENDVSAIVAGTDEILTGLADGGNKPITTAKIYYRSPATLWSKFINGSAGARFHRNCDRGGTAETNPEVYFDYVQHLRTFVNEVNLAGVDTLDDGLVSGLPDGIQADVLGSSGRWYAVHLYKQNPALTNLTLILEIDAPEVTYRWFNPESGEWSSAQEGSSDGTVKIEVPQFATTAALLISLNYD